ncbi:flavodoxin domain-containing protein [Profundibacter sp.]|uniref:flavodoxin domain-containing protein n=1 Tax=Profundibacter sp. TaxID=3101071 RepID=UPI003D129097
MPRRRNILIAYASRLGSTAEVAKTIADEIGAQTRCIDDIESLAGYDAVIIGSAIRYDKWLPEATDFVKTHQSTLQSMPVAMGCVSKVVEIDFRHLRAG